MIFKIKVNLVQQEFVQLVTQLVSIAIFLSITVQVAIMEAISKEVLA